LRDVSVAFAYLKIGNDTVTDVHKNLLRVAALNKYVVHLPYVNTKSISSILSYDCFKELTK
jgi:hypothetical protein